MNTYLSTGNEKECCGCLSCVYSCPTGAISKQERFDKFSYPALDAEKCINCGKCAAVCPNDRFLDLVEPVRATYALKHKDDKVRMNSSSGGAFTAISDLLLKENYKIYGAAFNSDFRVTHIGEYSCEGRDKMRLSKYVESNLENVFPQVEDDLKKGASVMFSGTPCQVAGLKAFLGKKYDNLFTVDLVCNGVTSPRIFEDYLKLVCDGKIKDITFRNKAENGWESSESMSVKCDGKINEKYTQCYMRMFFRSIGMREYCSTCKFASGKRAGDITIGDFWSIDWFAPEFKDDLGVSLLAVNTKTGEQLISKLSESCDIIKTETEKTVKSVGRMNRPADRSLIDDMFWKYYKTHSAEKTINIYGGDGFYSKLRRKPFEIIRSKIKK